MCYLILVESWSLLTCAFPPDIAGGLFHFKKDNAQYNLKPEVYVAKPLFVASKENQFLNELFLYVLEDLRTCQSLCALQFTSDDPDFVKHIVKCVYPPFHQLQPPQRCHQPGPSRCSSLPTMKSKWVLWRIPTFVKKKNAVERVQAFNAHANFKTGNNPLQLQFWLKHSDFNFWNGFGEIDGENQRSADSWINWIDSAYKIWFLLVSGPCTSNF